MMQRSRACLCCYQAKLFCDRNVPCNRCLYLGLDCSTRPPVHLFNDAELKVILDSFLSDANRFEIPPNASTKQY